MPLAADTRRARFTLSGAEFAPPDLADYPAEERKRYWANLAVEARDAKYGELAKAIDVEGRKLAPRKRRRRDRAKGPVLVPHLADSRFRTSLRHAATPDGAVLWWRFPWGKIVSYHAQGLVRGAPVRNVVGLTAASINKVIDRAFAWWKGHLKAGRLGEAGRTMQGERVAVPLGKGGLPEGYSTPWRKPPPRSKDSIFNQLYRDPKAPPRTNLAPATAKELPGKPKRPMPPWELQRTWRGLMDAAWRDDVTDELVKSYVAAVRKSQRLDVVRDVLNRLGVKGPIKDWAEAERLLRLQITERRGNLTNKWRPGTGGTPPVPKPRPPKPGPGVVTPPHGVVTPPAAPTIAASQPRTPPTIGERIKATPTAWRDAGAMGDLEDTVTKAEAAYKAAQAKLAGIADEGSRRGWSDSTLKSQTTRARADVDRKRAAVTEATLAIRSKAYRLAERPEGTRPVEWGAAFLADLGTPQAREVGKFAAWLKGVQADRRPEGAVPLPVWFDRTPARSQANYDTRTIMLDPTANDVVIAHEWGHILEASDPAVLRAAVEFLRYRVGDEPAVLLSEANPGGAYAPDERGRKDRFEAVFGPRQAYYVGKDYGDAATEVLAMGLEWLYASPARLGRDRELLAFLLGVLRGEL